MHLKFDLIRGVAFAWSGFTRGRLIYSIYDPGHTWQLYLKLKENILKQQSVDRQIAPLGYIILIPSQPVCSFSLMLYAIV
jgi:hypothetical protein